MPRSPPNAIQDIILVGGNANYNYTEYSDLDLHLVVDKDEIAACQTDFLDDFLRDKKRLWALTHDVTLYGQPVELYAQDINDPTPINQGTYSVLNNWWIQEPRKQYVDFTTPC